VVHEKLTPSLSEQSSSWLEITSPELTLRDNGLPALRYDTGIGAKQRSN